jgi:hypothetical protein
MREIAASPGDAEAWAGAAAAEIRKRYRPAAIASAFRESVETAREERPARR